VAEWRQLSLREAGVTLIDCDHRTPAAIPSGYSYVAIPQLSDGHIDVTTARRISRDDFESWTRKARPAPHDVVLSRRTNPGVTAFVPEDLEFALGQNLVLLRSDGRTVYPPFLRWLVRGPAWWGQIEQFLNVGAVFDSLKCADVPNFRLPIPPLAEQRRIADILGALDDKIVLNRRMSETLEASARALFKSWFVDFDPVRAKAEGRGSGLPHRLDRDILDSFVDSGAGPVPAGWSMTTLGTACSLTMGQSPPGDTYNESGEGLPFYQGRADFGFRFPRRRVYCTAPTRFARAGDTLVSVRAPVGDINMATEDCAIGRGVAAVRHRSGSRLYTYELLRSKREDFDHFEGEGTVFGSINRRDFEAMLCVAPPPSLVDEFDARVGDVDRRVEACERERLTLTALREALVPRLLSGEVPLLDPTGVAA
jgi:type I restriction enzyme S subunit